ALTWRGRRPAALRPAGIGLFGQAAGIGGLRPRVAPSGWVAALTQRGRWPHFAVGSPRFARRAAAPSGARGWAAYGRGGGRLRRRAGAREARGRWRRSAAASARFAAGPAAFGAGGARWHGRAASVLHPNAQRTVN